MDEEDDEQRELERTRELILQRRNRFIAAALAGLGAATSGCDSDGPSVCLSVLQSGTGGGVSGSGGTGGPSVCLSAPLGGTGVGGTGGVSGSGGTGGPSVCLSPPIEPCPWPGQQPPCVCLQPPDDDAGIS